MSDGPGVLKLKEALRRINQHTPAPPGLPASLYRRLQLAIVYCAPHDLTLPFIDIRIAHWVPALPTANTHLGRICALIAFLLYSTDDHGNNGLVLFLDVIHDQTDPHDACHQRIYKLRCELVHFLH